MIDTVRLEEFASFLRNELKIDSNTILNSNHLEELIQRIERHMEWFKIVTTESDTGLVLENEIYFTIYISGGIEEKFYNLIEMFVFAILLNKEELTANQLKRNVFGFPRLSKSERYLARAFMIPQKAFAKVVAQYSSADNSSVDLFAMQNNVNKYVHKRGIDLHYWIE